MTDRFPLRQDAGGAAGPSSVALVAMDCERLMTRVMAACALSLLVAGLTGCTQQTPAPGTAAPSRRSVGVPARYTLRVGAYWRVNPPAGGATRFDTSALVFRGDGALLTVNDRGAEVYRIAPRANNEPEADLVFCPEYFTQARLAKYASEKKGRYDAEGLAMDESGRLYLCEESNRWVLRCDPKDGSVERLPIDWAPVDKYFSKTDSNASFEGVAAGAGRIYVANERQVGRIIVVDAGTCKVVDHFSAKPIGVTAPDIHYTDLCWFRGALYALLRESRVVLKIDPATHRTLAQYDYSGIEGDPAHAYKSIYPTGNMEGLAVDDESIWLVTDNNGQGRVREPKDIRPTLFRCPRPDR